MSRLSESKNWKLWSKLNLKHDLVNLILDKHLQALHKNYHTTLWREFFEHINFLFLEFPMEIYWYVSDFLKTNYFPADSVSSNSSEEKILLNNHTESIFIVCNFTTCKSVTHNFTEIFPKFSNHFTIFDLSSSS